VINTEAAQARYVAQQILRAREAGVSLKQQIVLFRASHHSAQLEAELDRCNIPFQKYGGLKFIETAHVKDVRQRLTDFVKSKGGLNECAREFARNK
jgi:DNA helicase-2/ATP-dependent DNA helicase PcrA